MFFFGPDPGSEVPVEIEPGKTLIVKLNAVGEPHADGKRTVFFELNGQPRDVEITDRSLASSVRETPMADPADPTQVGSPLPGLVVGVAVAVGDPVRKGQKLLSIEAMKMETTIYAKPRARRRVARPGRPPGQDGRAADPDGCRMSRPWPFVRTMIDLDEVDSTSDRAARMVQGADIPLPFCVWARRQTRDGAGGITRGGRIRAA